MNPFDTAGFPARWYCGVAWSEQPWIGWLHIVSDIAIFASYYAVPMVVMYFVRQRSDLRFPPIFYGFLAMIFFSCGTVHLVEAGLFWWPAYKLSGYFKFLTAAVSATGVLFLARVLPTALELKSGKQYAAALEERRQAQEQLEYEQFLLRTMMGNLPDLIYFKDREGCFTRVSDSLAKFVGRKSPAELVGQMHRDFLPAAVAAKSHADDVRVMEFNEALIGQEEVGWSASGEQVWLSSTKLAMCNEAGEVIGMFGVSRDITPQKRASEAMALAKDVAERADRAKSVFLSRMSHELRTPLNSILGFAQLLETASLPERATESARRIHKAGDHLLSLIDEVLDISQIESGSVSVSTEPVNLTEILAGVVTMLVPMAREHGIAINLDRDTLPDVCVLADRQRLSQALINLGSNAIKYNNPNGSVSFSVPMADQDRVQIAVADTGPGIPPEKFDRLFVPFDRLDADRERADVEGTGMGLALTKTLVEAMHGDIRGANGENGGAVFTVELPAAESRPAGEKGSPAPSAPPAEPKVRTVLYIEDNSENLTLIQYVMEKRPQIQLLTAADGTQGVDLAVKERPDLIFLDYHLPDINGAEVIRRLEENAATRDLPVYVLSADATRGAREQMLALGAAEYLTKPLDINRFLEIIDSADGS